MHVLTRLSQPTNGRQTYAICVTTDKNEPFRQSQECHEQAMQDKAVTSEVLRSGRAWSRLKRNKKMVKRNTLAVASRAS